jgi:hypothetical protein
MLHILSLCAASIRWYMWEYTNILFRNVALPNANERLTRFEMLKSYRKLMGRFHNLERLRF